MIRAGLVVLFIGAVAVTALALSGDAGHASLTWLGWRADMTAAAAVIIVLFGALLVTVLWRALFWGLGHASARRTRARGKPAETSE